MIGPPHLIAVLMRQRPFNGVRRPLARLVNSVLAIARNPCAVISSAAKPMRRSAVVAVFSDIGFVGLPSAGKTYRPPAVSAIKLPVQVERLSRVERQNVLATLLHASGRYAPDRGLEVDFRPFGLPQLARPDKHMRREDET